MNNNLRGALWIVASGAGATVMSLGIRGLSPEIAATQIAFVRCAVGLLLIVPFLRGATGAPIRSARWRLHVLRGVIAAAAINFGFYSLTILPLTTVTVLFFTAPLFVTLLAFPILGERVGMRRLIATSIGFLGAIVVLRPGLVEFDPRQLFPMLSSLLFALSLLIGKKLSRTEAPATMMFYFGLIASVGSMPLAIDAWVMPDPGQIGLLLLVALTATARNYSDIKGYAAGEASAVAPFQYVRIVFIGVAAYWVFGEIPDTAAIMGAAIIVASTLYIANREARLSRGVGPILQQPDNASTTPGLTRRADRVD